MERENGAGVGERVRQIDHVAADLDRAFHQTGRTGLERADGVDHDVALTQDLADRAVVLDVDAHVAPRTRCDHRRDPDIREPARDRAAEEARAEDDGASQRSFTAR